MTATTERPRGAKPDGEAAIPPSPAPRPPRRRLSLIAALVLLAGAVVIGVTIWKGTAGRSHVRLPSPPAPGATAPGAPAAAAALAESVKPALVDVVTTVPAGSGTASASGMILTPSGLVATSAHVVDRAESILVTDPSAGRAYPARVVGYQSELDVAVVQMQSASGLRPIQSSSMPVKIGQGVVAVGNADGGNGPPVHVAGSITGLGRVVSVADPVTGEVQTLAGLIETNAPVVSGDSGGALVDATGKVVAMIAAGNADFEADSNRTRGYAVPIGQVLGVVRQVDTQAGALNGL